MGTPICHRIPNQPSPSIRPASSSSDGNPRKAWRMMKAPTTDGAPNTGSMISGIWVPSRLKKFMIWKSGTIIVSMGRKSPLSMITKSRSRPGNLMRAKAKPDMVETITVPTTVKNAT